MFCLIGLVVLCQISSNFCRKNGSMKELPILPEEKMRAMKLIKYNGYRGKGHEMVTDDGYVLTAQRMSNGRVNFTAANYSQPRQCWKQPVILQHGFAGSATDWLMNLPNQSLAYILADNGYDVWLSNSRGNRYSKRHKTYFYNQSNYWNFTWEDMAEKDLPTLINYVLNSTGCQKIVYVGHSHGTLLGFAKFSSDPILASKIKLFIALAPSSTIKNVTGSMKLLAENTKLIEIFSLSSIKSMMSRLKKHKPPCKGYGLSRALCHNYIFYMCDPEHKTMFNKTRIAVFLARGPENTSMKNLAHIGQMLKSGRMQKYDYGSKSKNKRIYGQIIPPQYYPENMTVPIAVFWSTTDVFTHPNDVIPLLEKLPNLVHNETLKNFTHLDFFWSLKVNEIINYKILRLLEDYKD